ncbi:MAG: JAB domain-containing protein [Bacteroidetes bacterium]|nr:JAB domain-containing protein [Bacteroidota bacterium]
MKKIIKPIEGVDVRIFKFLAEIKLDSFSQFIESIRKNPEKLFRKMASVIIPQERQDLIVKAEIDLYDLTVAELIHLAYTEGSKPVDRISSIYSLLTRDFALSSKCENIRLENKDKIKLFKASDIFKVMRDILLRQDILDQSREHLWAISLDNASTIINIHLVSKGTKDEVLVNPMEVFSSSIKDRANKIVLVHNHPSKELKPSQADIDLTQRLSKIGTLLNIPLIEHLIITPETYYSFYDNGLLDSCNDYKKIKSQMEIFRGMLSKQMDILSMVLECVEMKLIKR